MAWSRSVGVEELFDFSMNVRRWARSDGKNRTKQRPKARPETQRTEARSTFTGGDWSGS